TGGGTFNWIVDAGCQGRVSFNNPPDTPNISGTTLVSITSPRMVQCEVTVEWDHDNNGLTPAIVPDLPLAVFFDPLMSLEILSGPTGGALIPVGSTVEYEFLLRDNGFVVGANECSVEISFVSPIQGFFGPCSFSELISDGAGVARFSFASP